jgi:hypothetical protein
MLTYENVVTHLLSAAEQAGLNIIFSQEQLDTHALVRTFSMTCLPRGSSEPDDQQPRAMLSFRWDPALTAISVLGSEGLCDLYHTPDEPCPHADLGCAYDASLDVEASYHVPTTSSYPSDVNGVIGMASGTRELLTLAVGHEEGVEVQAQLLFDEHGVSVGRIEALQRWSLDDELHEADDLSGALSEVCQEVVNALEALAGHEAPHPSHLPADDVEDYGDGRTYLRPPTA